MIKTAKRRGGGFGAFLRDIAGSCYDMRRYREFRTSSPGAGLAIERGTFSTTLEMPHESRVGDLRVLVDTGIEGTGLPEGRVAGTAAVVGKDAVFFADDGTAQTYAFKDMEDARVSKEEIAAWLRRNGVLMLTAGMGAFGIGYFLALVLGVGVFVLATSLLAMLLAR